MSVLHKISTSAGGNRVADVLFLHGLGGDAFSTWRCGKDQSTSWPHWLAEEFPDVGIWSLGYAASPTKRARGLRKWISGDRDAGHAMPLPDRAREVVDLMVQHQLGSRPLLLIGHSLGGLLAKQILRRTNDETRDDNHRIFANTKAVLFLGTPHQGASLASLADRFRAIFGPTASMEDLRAHDAHLGDLFDWYRNHSQRASIETFTYFETRDVFGFRIVDRTTSHPGVGPDPVGLDEDHISLAKPRDRNQHVVNKAREFVKLVTHGMSGTNGEGDNSVEERIVRPGGTAPDGDSPSEGEALFDPVSEFRGRSAPRSSQSTVEEHKISDLSSSGNRIPRTRELVEATAASSDRPLSVRPSASEASAYNFAPPSERKSPMATKKLRVFLSYSHKDENELNRLNVHLADLKHHNLIETWHDRQIRGGSQWKPEILQELDQADVILLLVSPDFIASSFCRLVEMNRAIQRDRDGTALVIPVALKPVARFPVEISHLQGVPRDLKAVTAHRPKDKGFIAAVALITEAIEAFAAKPKKVPSSNTDEAESDFEERHQRAIKAAADEFCAIIDSDISSDIRNQIISTLRLPDSSPAELRSATLLLFDGQKPNPDFYSNAMSDLSGLARNPKVGQKDAKAIEQVQMLLTRRLFPRRVLGKLVAEFRARKSAVIGAVANHIGAEVAAKSAYGLEPTFVPSNEAGANGVAGHGLLKFVAAPLGKPSPEEDVAQILKELASQIELDLDQPEEIGDTPEARIRYWAGRINRKVNGKAREWWKATRPLDDTSELSATVFYCVIRQPSGAKRDKLHALLQTVREHAPALLFFELNPLADFRDDEDTALEFVSRLFNAGKEETS